MNKEQQKDEIILAVKQAFNDNAEPTPFVREYIELDGNDIDHIAEQTAETLYNAGYRKIPETAVVISGEDRDEEMRACNEERAELEAEIERLEKVIKDKDEICFDCKKTVKDFAKKLKDNYSIEANNPAWGYMKFIEVNAIDELLKEYEK